MDPLDEAKERLQTHAYDLRWTAQGCDIAAREHRERADELIREGRAGRAELLMQRADELYRRSARLNQRADDVETLLNATRTAVAMETENEHVFT